MGSRATRMYLRWRKSSETVPDLSCGAATITLRRIQSKCAVAN
jgi:hypothetical protein